MFPSMQYLDTLPIDRTASATGIRIGAIPDAILKHEETGKFQLYSLKAVNIL
jgi:hypothetical protein